MRVRAMRDAPPSGKNKISTLKIPTSRSPRSVSPAPLSVRQEESANKISRTPREVRGEALDGPPPPTSWAEAAAPTSWADDLLTELCSPQPSPARSPRRHVVPAPGPVEVLPLEVTREAEEARSRPSSRPSSIPPPGPARFAGPAFDAAPVTALPLPPAAAGAGAAAEPARGSREPELPSRSRFEGPRADAAAEWEGPAPAPGSRAPRLATTGVNTDGHWANPGARMSEGLEREMLRECKDLQRTERSLREAVRLQDERLVVLEEVIARRDRELSAAQRRLDEVQEDLAQEQAKVFRLEVENSSLASVRVDLEDQLVRYKSGRGRSPRGRSPREVRESSAPRRAVEARREAAGGEVAAERLDFEPARRGSEGVSEAPAHVDAPPQRPTEARRDARGGEVRDGAETRRSSPRSRSGSERAQRAARAREQERRDRKGRMLRMLLGPAAGEDLLGDARARSASGSPRRRSPRKASESDVQAALMKLLHSESRSPRRGESRSPRK